MPNKNYCNYWTQIRRQILVTQQRRQNKLTTSSKVWPAHHHTLCIYWFASVL